MTAQATPTATYEPCGQCGSPLDEEQRYCVVCGASRRHPSDPLARYLAASRRTRTAARPTAPPRRGDGRWTAAAFALLPIAAATGVLVGRGGSSGEGAVADALRAQKPPIIQISNGQSSGQASTATTAAAASITSDFTLSRGFVVRLRTLPAAGTDAAAVAAAERAAKAKGATQVGVINPSDFRLTPSSGGAYVLYSGEFKTRAAAQRALSRLKPRFPGAAVVAVGKAASRARTPLAAAPAATTRQPTAKQKAQGAKVVKQIQQLKGQGYVKQQRDLPDTIVVP